MNRRDVIVIGGGPSGVAAAETVAAAGLDCLLIDEGAGAGGRVHWPARHDPSRESQALAARLAASGADCLFGERVWTVEPGFRVETSGPAGMASHAATAVIVAVGAIERAMPVPGWTLRGVTGLAAATVLLKAQRVLPGQRVVVAGTGPLLPLVAAAILDLGGEVAAMVDARYRREWLVPELALRSDLAFRGARWLARLARRRVPIRYGHAVRAILGRERVEAVEIAPLDGGSAECIAADAVCIGFGLTPSAEISRLLGAAHRYIAGEGWIVDTDAAQRTSVPGLYACGDGARVLGADAAPATGRIAAQAAVHDLGHGPPPRSPSKAEARAMRFGAAMTRLSYPPAALIDMIGTDTLVCRCEAVSRAAIEACTATSLAGLKSATRCGMGPCGGRLCSEAAAMLLAARNGIGREVLQPPSVRPPLRPIDLGVLTDEFDYADLPIPEPAPL